MRVCLCDAATCKCGITTFIILLSQGSRVRIPLNRTVKEEEIQHALLLGVPKRQKRYTLDLSSS